MVAPNATVNWWLDCRETLVNLNGEEFQNTFYVGPFTYDVDSKLSIQQFMDDINLKFQAVTTATPGDLDSAPSTGFPHGLTMNEYTVTPKVLTTTGTPNRLVRQTYGSDVGVFNSLVGGPANVATVKDFVIEYRILPIGDGYEPSDYTLRDISIQAVDGIHGSNMPAIGAYADASGIPGSASEVNAETPYATVTYENAPNTVFYEVPSTSTQAIMLDSPPLPPNLVIAPYQGVNNRLMLMLNSNTGEYLARPEIIKATDAAMIADLYMYQSNVAVSPNEVVDMLDDPANPLKLLYKNDDPLKRYEIFRTTSRPQKYSDFGSTGTHAFAESKVFVDKESSAASFIDSISPNTKYYYCVRALDIHNNFSNPTHIFEAELVDNEGQVYLILKTISLTIEKRKVYNKAGKRYLYLEPAIRNLQVDESYIEANYQNATIETLPGQDILGLPEDGAAGEATGPDVWNKTFKIRLTSRESNKKIDLNITFKNTGVDYP
jgi:hypothetical protein